MSKISTIPDIDVSLQGSFSEGGLILNGEKLGKEFFDLRTGLAGALFQKFTNYQQKLAIVLDDNEISEDRFRELVLEHSNHPNIRFFESGEEGNAQAVKWIKN